MTEPPRVPAPPPPLVRLERVSRRHRPERPALFEELSLELDAGEYIAIMGESGVGKSSLINLLAGLDRPDTGRISIEGVDITALDDDAMTLLRRRSVGFVFQAFHVLPYLTVQRNVALPLELLKVRGPEREQRTLAMLAAVGIDHLAERPVRELSGGEVQRVAIARALVHRPRLVLADEPTGNLDPRNAQQILGLLRAQIKSQAGGGILITHSHAAARTADRILVLDGDGLHPA